MAGEHSGFPAARAGGRKGGAVERTARADAVLATLGYRKRLVAVRAGSDVILCSPPPFGVGGSLTPPKPAPQLPPVCRGRRPFHQHSGRSAASAIVPPPIDRHASPEPTSPAITRRRSPARLKPPVQRPPTNGRRRPSLARPSQSSLNQMRRCARGPSSRHPQPSSIRRYGLQSRTAPPAGSISAELFRLAVYHQRAGRLRQREAHYRALLQRNELDRAGSQQPGPVLPETKGCDEAIKGVPARADHNPQYDTRATIWASAMASAAVDEAAAEFQRCWRRIRDNPTR